MVAMADAVCCYIRKQYESGLDYIGYYKTNETNLSAEYNFIFIEKAALKTHNTYSLQFESKHQSL